ncbi:Transmembrane protein [Hirschfeldia incana]|nr:Transmembrane protein [Hirschfeldia incana]
MSATTTPYLSLPSFRPRFQNPAKTHQLSPLSWSVPRRKILSFDRQQAPTALLLHQDKNQSWRLSATPEEISQEIVSSDTSSSEAIVSGGGQDGVALIIQVLLIVAFLALSVLTIGVVYIGVTEFLGKREREKFEKEEAAKKSKKSGKKKATRAKAGPRGFGQKIEDDDFDIDLE